MEHIKINKHKDKFVIEKYIFSEWKKKFRPDGKGKIVIGSFNDKQEVIDTEVIEFTEVVCDFCNDEIFPMAEDESKETNVYVLEDFAICEKCFNKDYKPYIEYDF